MLYVLENNGVYGLTKGQFSASADQGSTSKKGEANTMEADRRRLLALTLGATFVARSFSGDKAQLVPIIKAGLAHSGFAFIDVISPCVTFNDHEGSTKSYAYTREHNVEVVQADFVPLRDAITDRLRRGHASRTSCCTTAAGCGCARSPKDYDPTDRDGPTPTSASTSARGEVLTGLLYISPDSQDMHDAERDRARPAHRAPVRPALSGQRRVAEAAATVPVISRDQGSGIRESAIT